MPVLLDDQLDADGKARAIRIIDGQFVKDASGKELRFASADLNNAETDMRLRSVHPADAWIRWRSGGSESRGAQLGGAQTGQFAKAPIHSHPPGPAGQGNQPGRSAKPWTRPSPCCNWPIRIPRSKLAAVQHLAELKAIGSLDSIKASDEQAGLPGRTWPRPASAPSTSLKQHISFVNFFGTIFHGLSLGSILLVVALGLAITFGLMGIINMAHGEMIAVGAYTCYVVQNIFGPGFGFSITLPFSFGGKMLSFGLHIPGLNATGWLYESYFLFAIPLSFLMAALAGLAIERTVIRFLYRRPLESLLATWGISLVMQQLFPHGFRRQQRPGQFPLLAAGPFLASTT